MNVAIYHSDKLDEYLSLFEGRFPNDRVTPIRAQEDLPEALANAEVLVANNSFPFSALEHAKKLRWVQVMAAGVDPWLPVLPQDVRISRVTGSFGPRMAEFAIGYLFAITQRMPEVFSQQIRKEWKTLDLDVLAEKTLGVVGLGSIGGAVAKLGKSIGLNVAGLSNSRPTNIELDEWWPSTELKRFLPTVDFLVLTAPLTKQTRRMIDAEALNEMKSTAWLVNIARGQIVDESALIDALQRGRPAGAVLDVFEQEPLPADNPLWELSNVIVASHQSGSTIPQEVVDVFEENIKRYQAGEPLLYEVDRSRGY